MICICKTRDLVVETKDENGNVTFAPNTNLMLPPGKKAVVLSVDDLSYYHSYKPAGFPERLVLDDNGDVKCLYKTSEWQETYRGLRCGSKTEYIFKEAPGRCLQRSKRYDRHDRI